jgi:hypothetical protein
MKKLKEAEKELNQIEKDFKNDFSTWTSSIREMTSNLKMFFYKDLLIQNEIEKHYSLIIDFNRLVAQYHKEALKFKLEDENTAKQTLEKITKILGNDTNGLVHLSENQTQKLIDTVRDKIMKSKIQKAKESIYIIKRMMRYETDNKK